MKRKNDLAMHVRLGATVILFMGAWLVLASLALDYGSTGAALSNTIMGFLLVVLALVAMRAPLEAAPICWIIGAIGIWVAVSPIALGYTSHVLVMANNLWTGILSVLLSAFIAGEAQGLEAALESH